GGAPDLEDAADQLEADAVAEFPLQQIPEAPGGLVVDRGGFLVAAKFENDLRHAFTSRCTNSMILLRAAIECGGGGTWERKAWLMPSNMWRSAGPPALR